MIKKAIRPIATIAFLILIATTGLHNGNYSFGNSPKKSSFEELLDHEEVEEEGTVTDIDGNEYKTVKIGHQIWMAENLRVTHYSNGDPIPRVRRHSEWASLENGAYTYYMNFRLFSRIYGALYNWYAVDDDRGLCPEGWRVPDYDDWWELIYHLGGKEVAGGKLKSTSRRWRSPNYGATNEKGFNALPGGYRYSNGSFYFLGSYGDWWTSSAFDSSYVWFKTIGYDGEDIEEGTFHMRNGLSVRCIKDQQ